MRERSNRIRALIVDDSSLTLELLRNFLEELPFVELVGAAESGDQALTLASTLKPDLVVTDLRMPEMDGLELARKLKEASPKTHVILATIEDSELLEKAAGQHNVRAVVLKDRLADDLAHRILSLFPEAR